MFYSLGVYLYIYLGELDKWFFLFILDGFLGCEISVICFCYVGIGKIFRSLGFIQCLEVWFKFLVVYFLQKVVDKFLLVK